LDGDAQNLAELAVSGSDCYSLASVNVYPNPSYKQFFFVEIETSRPQETDIAMFDQSGKQVFRTRYALDKGNNWLRISSKTFAPGVYHLRFAAGEEIVTRKISII
jgi:hypothetical protein